MHTRSLARISVRLISARLVRAESIFQHLWSDERRCPASILAERPGAWKETFPRLLVIWSLFLCSPDREQTAFGKSNRNMWYYTRKHDLSVSHHDPSIEHKQKSRLYILTNTWFTLYIQTIYQMCFRYMSLWGYVLHFMCTVMNDTNFTFYTLNWGWYKG